MMNKPQMKKTMNQRSLCFGLFATLMIAGFTLKITAQQLEPNPSPSQNQTNLQGNTYEVVEEQPQFKGGMAAFQSYVARELNYPLPGSRELRGW